MWCDRSISAAVVRQDSCSSRQLVNSDLIGSGKPPDPLRSSASGPPAALIASSRLGMLLLVLAPMPRMQCPHARRLPSTSQVIAKYLFLDLRVVLSCPWPTDRPGRPWR